MTNPLVEAYRGKCGRCLTHPATGTHHIIPRSSGGKDEPDNLIPLCNECHTEVHNNTSAYLTELREAQERADLLFKWRRNYEKPIENTGQ
jgi:ATP-dependent DNA helicase RecQ